jgi:asparagine synthase (glutamine-hydrolysing)
MCGIISIKGKKIKEFSDDTVGKMLGCLARRGPDDRGFVRQGDTIIGQTRLSIVDIVAGKQPMKDNAHPYTIVFNGEIYGYKELKKILEARGHRFSTSSDTEVILKAYAEYGYDCVKHLDGQFAFAIIDEKKDEMFIARDRFGKKPFYYAWSGQQPDQTFLAASEIKAIFASGKIKGVVSIQALQDYLQLRYIPPYETIYSNIFTLLPGHAGIVKNGALNTWRYWQLEKKTITPSREEAKSEIKRLLMEAVNKRMVADVEIGSLLSGGVDSTLVTAFAQECTGTRLKTFALGYGDYKNELPFAKEASDKIGTDHYTLTTKSVNMHELRNVIQYFDEPHADSSDFPQHLISKLAASKVKVALSGDGADELFMGYGWYKKYWDTPRWKRVFDNPYSSYKKAIEVFTKKECNDLIKYSRSSNVNSDAFNKTFKERPGISDPFEKINIFDLSVYLPGQLLVKVDRTSMMHSLEMRSPFLDTALAEYVYNLPLEYKLARHGSKMILKELLGEIMPKEFVHRQKQGFGGPLHEWMKEPAMKNELEKLLAAKDHPMYTYLSREAVKKILSRSSEYDKTEIQKVWSILCLAIWFEFNHQHIDI